MTAAGLNVEPEIIAAKVSRMWSFAWAAISSASGLLKAAAI
jgi:hypothetical protein